MSNKFFTGPIKVAVLPILLVLAAVFVPAGRALSEAGQSVSYADLFGNISDISSITEDNNFLPYAAQAENGVKIIGTANGAEFVYKPLIDAESIHNEANLIKMLVLHGGDYATVNRLYIKLTDAHDPDNVLTIRFTSASDKSYSYVLVSQGGSYHAISNESAFEGYLFTDTYGTLVRQTSLAGSAVSGKTRAFAVQLDYAAKAIYVDSGGVRTFVFDLDNADYVGVGGQWNGFKTGEFKLSVAMEFESVKPGGVIVSEVAGNSISGAFDDQTSAKSQPHIRIVTDRQYLKENGMPNAVVGMGYTIPSIVTTDWFLGAPSTGVAVYFEQGGVFTQQTEGLEEGVFTPSAAGLYRIDYSAQNAFGNIAHEQLFFRAWDTALPIIISPEQQPASLKYGATYTVPKFFASGGSGVLKVTEIAEFGGKTFDLSVSRNILIDRPAPLKITVIAEDYNGSRQTLVMIKEFEEQIFFDVRGMPWWAVKGQIVTLPDFTPEVAAGLFGEITKEITADGVSVDLQQRQLYITKSAGEVVTVVYTATANSVSWSLTYFLEVFQPTDLSDYVRSEGGSATSVEEGIKLVADNEDNCFSFKGAAAAEDMLLRLFAVPQASSYEALKIVFTDFYDEGNIFSVRVTSDGQSSFLWVNNQKYRLSFSFSSASESLGLILSAASGFLKSDSGAVICTLGTFSAQAVTVSVILEGIYGEAEIILNRISNQPFMPDAFRDGDSRPPVIIPQSPMQSFNRVSIGNRVVLPAVKAYDVLDAFTEVTLEVSDPSGNTIYSGAAEAYSFNTQKYGVYRAKYSAVDSSMIRAQKLYFFSVVDEISPVMTIEGILPERARIGDAVKLPAASAVDNYDDAPLITVAVFNVADFSSILVKSGDSYTFTKAGRYKIIYRAVDSAYNITEKVYHIVVD